MESISVHANSNDHLSSRALDDEGVPDYFQTPDRQGLIQQLVHLAQFGDGLPVVQGISGSGKSTIADELKKQFVSKGTNYFASVSVTADQPLESILRSVSESFGIPDKEMGSAGERLVQLRSFTQEIVGDKHLGIIVIDDAHFLNDQALGGLISLLQGNDASGHGLHMILFSKLGLAERIDRIGLLDISVYDFEVPLLSLADFSQFAQQTLSHSIGDEKSNDILTQEKLLALWTQTQGAPGAALRLLADLVEQENQSQLENFKGMPLGHILALVMLLSVLGWAFFIRDNSEVEVKAGPDISLDKSGVVTLPLAKEKKVGKGADREADTLADTYIPKVNSREEPQKRLVESGKEIKEEGATLKPGVEIQAKKDKSKPKKNELKLSETAVSNKRIAKPISKPSAAALNTREISESARIESAEQDVKLDLQRHVEGAPSANRSGRVRIVAADNIAFENDERILLDHVPESYTLQVVAATNKNSLRDYIARQPNKADLYLYQGLREGKRWYIVVAGIYETRLKASAAIKTLPAEQRKAGPWPKRLKAIHDEIAANRSR